MSRTLDDTSPSILCAFSLYFVCVSPVDRAMLGVGLLLPGMNLVCTRIDITYNVKTP